MQAKGGPLPLLGPPQESNPRSGWGQPAGGDPGRDSRNLQQTPH